MTTKSNYQCDHPLDDLKVSSEKVKQIFNINKTVKENTYQNTICDILKETYKCSFNIKNANKKGKNAISFYLYCIVNRDKNYLLKCYKSDIKEGEELTFEVRTNTTTVCSHVEQDIRNLSKDKRQEVKNLLKDSTVTKVSFSLSH